MPCSISLVVTHALNLIKPRDGISHVRRVFQRKFSFAREREFPRFQRVALGSQELGGNRFQQFGELRGSFGACFA